MFTLIFRPVTDSLFAMLWWIVTSQKQARSRSCFFSSDQHGLGLLLIVGFFRFGVYGTLTTQVFPTVGLLVFGLSSAFCLVSICNGGAASYCFLSPCCNCTQVLAWCHCGRAVSSSNERPDVAWGEQPFCSLDSFAAHFPTRSVDFWRTLFSVKVRTVSQWQLWRTGLTANGSRTSRWGTELVKNTGNCWLWLQLCSCFTPVRLTWFLHVVEQLRPTNWSAPMDVVLGFCRTIALSFQTNLVKTSRLITMVW